MAGQYLATYLNDHLAGAVVALELLESLERAHAGTAIARFASELRGEIAAERRELAGIMARLGVPRSGPRMASAWLSEKLTEIKLRIDDPQGGALRLLETFESLSLGIEGKRLLWRALGTTVAEQVDLAMIDFERLERRAEAQRCEVENLRLEAARASFLIPSRHAV